MRLFLRIIFIPLFTWSALTLAANVITFVMVNRWLHDAPQIGVMAAVMAVSLVFIMGTYMEDEY